MNNWLEILLTFLKFAGVVVSGVAGLIAVASAEEGERKVPKTRAGIIMAHVFNKRWAMHCAIIGLVVALLSQFSETLKTTFDEKTARRKDQQVNQALQQQISIATEALEKLEEQGATVHHEMLYLEYMAGKFKKISVDLTFEVPTTQPDFAPLVQKIEEIISPEGISAFQRMTNAIPPNTPGVAYSKSVIGYINSKDKMTGEVHTFVASSATVPIPVEYVFDPKWITDVSTNVQLMTFFNSISSPRLKLELFSRRVTDTAAYKPDFVALTSTQRSLPFFYFDKEKNRITLDEMPATSQCCFKYNTVTKQTTVNWHFNLTPESWRQTIRMSSVFDLDDARLRLSFGGASNPDLPKYHLQLSSAKLDFGLVRITLDNLLPLERKKQKTNETNYSYIFTGTIPPPNSLQIEDYEFSPAKLSQDDEDQDGDAAGELLTTQTCPSFNATDGSITAPFTTTASDLAPSGGYISQERTTGLSEGGIAIYSFAVANSGKYVISALVNTPRNTRGSFYVNIDSEPVDPTMIWDIPATGAFTNLIISWRGSGTETNNFYDPQIFNLGAGDHTLIIRGRRAGTQLAGIFVVPCIMPHEDAPVPTGIHVIAEPPNKSMIMRFEHP